MDTIKLYFDGVKETCSVTQDANGDFVCRTEDDRFVKFPNGDLEAMATAYNETNNKKVILAEEPTEVIE